MRSRLVEPALPHEQLSEVDEESRAVRVLLGQPGHRRPHQHFRFLQLSPLAEQAPEVVARDGDGDVVLAVRLPADLVMQKGLDLAIAVHGADYWRTGVAWSARGAWHHARGDRVRAREDLERAWSLLKARPLDDPRRNTSLERLAVLHESLGEPEAMARYRALENEAAP